MRADRDPPVAEGRVRRVTRADLALFAVALIVSGVFADRLGQDLNFDLLSYHFYNGYALIHGRLDRDIAPVGWHTYINPVMDAFFYLGMVWLPPRVFGFALGMLQGLNFPLLYMIARSVLADIDQRRARLIGFFVAVVGSLGPNATSLLGTTMGNNIVSIPELAAILVVLAPAGDGRFALGDPVHRGVRLFWAGLLAGVATGLRLTALGDHVSLFLVLLVFSATRGLSGRSILRFLASFGGGSLLGFLVVSGYWSWELLEHFGNPVFPFANQIFRSPFFQTTFYRDDRWRAVTALDFLRPPFDIALGHTHRLQEIAARDGRFLLLFLALALSVFVALVRRLQFGKGASMTIAEHFVVSYWMLCYVVWEVAFYYYRYLTPLEMLAPLVLFILVRSVVPSRALVSVVVALSIALAVYTRTESWGRGDWRDNWFGLDLPPLAAQRHAMVLLLGGPVGFAIPYFAADAKFIHLTAIRDKGGTALFDEAIVQALEAHHGPLFILSSFRVDASGQDPRRRRPRWVYDPDEDARPLVEPFGLVLTDRCEDMRTRRLRLYLCELGRDPARSDQDVQPPQATRISRDLSTQ